ncbi:acyl-CoA thioesterase [Thermogemmatispora sp.]|uniref:acyl-CoA thioesterase n=1 Tax=Thermogemmatispora sp. TaxID=1968838 RepID=UPI0035E42509
MEPSTGKVLAQAVQEFDVSLVDMDPFFIHYTAYSIWMDRGFLHLLKTLGHPLHTLFAEGYGFPVVHCQLDFWEPAALDERVRLTTALVRLGRTSLTVRYAFARVEANGSLTPLARGESVHVYTERATRQPHELPGWLRSLEGGTAPASSETG